MTGSPPSGAGLSLGAGSHDLGPQLEPHLRRACEDKISDIRWFRTDWQRGGAATAFAKVTAEDGAARDTVVKLPLGPREYRFLTRLGVNGSAAPTPRVLFHGLELGGYDLGWVVMERLPGAPVSAQLHHEVFERLARALARFHAHATEASPMEPPDSTFNWPLLLEKARANVKDNHLLDEQRWVVGLKHVQRVLPKLLALWNGRAVNTWCHGDVQPANAMMRPDGSAWGPAGMVLLDLAEVHPGHWVEDAVYLERQFWGRPDLLGEVKPVSLIAKARKAEGLDCSDDYATLANVRRLLMAAVAPAFVHREGSPRYFHAALEMMERQVGVVGK